MASSLTTSSPDSQPTYFIEIHMNMANFLTNVIDDIRPLRLPKDKLCPRLHRLHIQIMWEYSHETLALGNFSTVPEAADLMQQRIEAVLAALAPIRTIDTIEVVCFSSWMPEDLGGLGPRFPGPVLSQDLLKPFEVLHLWRPRTAIWITDVHSIVGYIPRDGDTCASLQLTMAKLALLASAYKRHLHRLELTRLGAQGAVVWSIT